MNLSTKLNIYYVYNSRFPTERGQGIQIAKAVDGLTQLEHRVTLIVPERDQTTLVKRIKSVRRWYNLKNEINVIYIDTPKPKGRLITLAGSVVLVWKVWSLLRKKSVDLIYSRDDFVAGIFAILGFKTFYEGHFEPERGSLGHKFWLKRANGIVVNTKKLLKRYEALGFNKQKLLYLPNGVDKSWFDQKPTQILRRKLNIPKNEKLVVYAGSMYEWKGIEALIEAMKEVERACLVLIGGMKEDLIKWKKKALNKKNIYFLEQVSHEELKKYLASADVLVVPHSSEETHSRDYTAPIKLFEYAVLKKPIVASNIPSVTNLLSKSDLLLVKPDDSRALAKGIKNAFKVNTKMVEKAFNKAKEQTWEKRTERLVSFIEKNI
jgi:glycosyltransferase involved in cell wall biosynthesis